MSEDYLTIGKIVLIEKELWEKARNIIRERNVWGEKFEKNISEVVNKLLLRWKAERKIEHYQQENQNKKNVKIEFTPEALDVYNNFGKGSKNYFVNCLLRTWIRENS